MRATQLLERAVTINPEGEATICGDRVRTWREIGERVPRIAAALRAMGVENGDSVAILAMNSDYHAELFYGVPWAGGVFAPLNIRWSTEENKYALKDSRASVLFVDASFVEQAKQIEQDLPSVTQLVYIGEEPAPEGMLHYEQLVADYPPMADAFRCNDDIYVLFYTGGTTGHPKGVAMSHRAIVFGTMAYLAMLPDSDGIRHLYVPGFFHFAAGNPLWTTTLAGGTNIILPKFDPVPVLEAIQCYRVTNTILVPTMINILLNHKGFDQYDLTSMRTCIYGGSPMPESLIQQTMSKLPGWRFYQIYGMTETCGFATMLRWEDHIRKDERAGRLRSAGQPSPCSEVRTIRPDGSRCDTEEIGEIIVRSDNLMSGYLNNPRQTADVLIDGWMHTGDAGYFDKDGYLYVADRIKDMIVTGGENVYSSEVERVLYTHSAVLEAAVVGIPSEAWGEQVHGVVVIKPGADCSDRDLIEYCRQFLGGYKVPKSIEFSAEPLPTTAVGKIRKVDLRNKYWQNLNTKI